MCYEDLRQLYAATAKERDELKKELERMKCLYEMVKAERYWLFELVEGTCISCKRQYGSPGVNCSLCKESDDLWEYAWEGK